MVNSINSTIELIKKYVNVLENHNIEVQEAVLFGSYAKGVQKEESDIDIAIISNSFIGDRFEDRRRIVPLRRTIDNRIEPIPLTPIDFRIGGNLIDDIKSNGICIK
jgi:uncharacterized protein